MKIYVRIEKIILINSPFTEAEVGFCANGVRLLSETSLVFLGLNDPRVAFVTE
ncbi:MAG: hypothetical protein AAF206_01685 [Bacteroidota bacterium]